MASVVIHDIETAPSKELKKKKNKRFNMEWIELRNASDEQVNLDDWTIKDRVKSTGEYRTLYTFQDLVLGPGQIVRVHSGSYEDRVEHPSDGDLEAGVAHLYANHKNWIWSTKMNEVFVMDEYGEKVAYKVRVDLV
jgi:hypothetical protein